ncbi:MAG: hypothetical protein KDA47_02530, partial [Planctomycetales bacterium]|nr:hypothetical protein [Planctomycetales bacterium]
SMQPDLNTKSIFGLRCRRIWTPKVFLASNAAGFERKKSLRERPSAALRRLLEKMSRCRKKSR